MSDQPKCNLCGEPMPPGEEMFKFHGYSGPCPTKPMPAPHVIERRSVPENRHYAAVKHVDLDALEAELAQAKATARKAALLEAAELCDEHAKQQGTVGRVLALQGLATALRERANGNA